MNEISLLSKDGGNTQSLSTNLKEKQNSSKAKSMEKTIKENTSKLFRNSNIVNDKEAQLVFWNLPGIFAFETELIFSVGKEKLGESFEKAISSYPKTPLVVLIQYGNEKFGGFASEAWDLSKK